MPKTTEPSPTIRSFLSMRFPAGMVNAGSVINRVEVKGEGARFILKPRTGKTQQLRLHRSGLGFGRLNDRYYPELQDEGLDILQPSDITV